MKREWLLIKMKSTGMTYEQIACKVGVTSQCIWHWVAGIRTPNPDRAKKIAKVLDFDWTKFYEKGD